MGSLAEVGMRLLVGGVILLLGFVFVKIMEFIFGLIGIIITKTMPAWLIYALLGAGVGYSFGSALGSKEVFCSSIGVIIGIVIAVVEKAKEP